MKTALLVIPVMALLVCVGCFPNGNDAPEPKAKPAAPVDENPPVVRPPDVGPRIDAESGTHELEGVRVRVKEVWVSAGIDDGVTRWGNVPNAMWMKVKLEYQYLTANSEATYYWWNFTTAKASAVYDDESRKYQGVNGGYYSKEETRKLLKEGLGRPTKETIYFKAPKRGSAFYDLDLVPEHLPPGQKYQFRIPADMVEWQSKN